VEETRESQPNCYTKEAASVAFFAAIAVATAIVVRARPIDESQIERASLPEATVMADSTTLVSLLDTVATS
jgi:hypothetical protein